MMSGKLSLEWRRRHRGHSISSAPIPTATLEQEEAEVEEEGSEADEVEAAVAQAPSVPVTEVAAEFLSLHISEWMLSILAMPSMPVSPALPGSWSSLDLWFLDSCLLLLKKEAREMRLFLGAFFTEGRDMEEPEDCMSRSEPMTPLLPQPSCWGFCKLISLEGGEGCARGEPAPGNLSLACAETCGCWMGLGDGVRWWMGDGAGEEGPGRGERAPEGPSVFKTWWLLLMSLVVRSRRRILAKKSGLLAVKLLQQPKKGEKKGDRMTKIL